MLEEIGDLPMPGQRRLLKLFAEGSEDYNIITTTHRDLQALCNVGVFLRDLYDKISARRITVPALRMRAESIVPLAQNFAKAFKADKPVKLSPGAIDKMRSYSWPGNVLELRNAMERAVALADGGEILAEHLPGDMMGGSTKASCATTSARSSATRSSSRSPTTTTTRPTPRARSASRAAR